jgi:hypothetical protein
MHWDFGFRVVFSLLLYVLHLLIVNFFCLSPLGDVGLLS